MPATGERSIGDEVRPAWPMHGPFIARLAHALRSPLNAIDGWTSLLDECAGTAGASPLFTPAVAGIHAGVAQQVRLIDTLCDASAILTGCETIVRAPIRMRTAIDGALERTRDVATDSGAPVDVALDITDETVAGDYGRLVQVFAELLSNALRVTPRDGRVVVTARAAAGRVIVAVADSGCGLAPGYAKWLWDPLRDLGSTGVVDSGLGLGLAVTKALVVLHDGSIEAYSAGRGRGTTMTVDLPLAPSTPASTRSTS